MQAEYVDHMGTDLSVVNAARVSFDKRSDWKYKYLAEPKRNQLTSQDENLIRYLARGMSSSEWENYLHEIGYEAVSIEDSVRELMLMATHWVPFTHTAITLRMRAPVPIRTQCFKSKIGFTESEESRRYISSVPVLFIPDSFRERSSNKKQGSGGIHPNSEAWLKVYKEFGAVAITTYQNMIADGICEEQARFILPQGVEVNWIWTGNLAAYARYFNLRYDVHAQKESQKLALQVAGIIQPLFPVSWEALTRPIREEEKTSDNKEQSSGTSAQDEPLVQA